jgi:hypothetical protein
MFSFYLSNLIGFLFIEAIEIRRLKLDYFYSLRRIINLTSLCNNTAIVFSAYATEFKAAVGLETMAAMLLWL